MTGAKRRVLIIGRNGQVSRSLRERLTGAGYDVVVASRPEVDLSDLKSMAPCVHGSRAEVVINSAAYTAVDRAEDEPAVAEAVNVLGAEAVAMATAELGVPVIHFSTDYVFDGRKRQPYVEDDATGPMGVYGSTKLAGEISVAAANPRHIILRTAWVFSPFGNNFVRTMLRLAGGRPELRVVNDQYGSPTFAADLADVVQQMLPRIIGPSPDARYFGVFHAVNSGSTTWCGFAEAIMRGAELRGAAHVPVLPIGSKDFLSRAARPAYSLLSAAKLRQVYGIALRPWDEALSDCLDQVIAPARKVMRG